MQFTSSACLAILTYCASVTALAIPEEPVRSAIYGEHEHVVDKEHPHFKRNVNPQSIVHPMNYDGEWIWRDPEMCGFTHGNAFNWIEERYYKFRHHTNIPPEKQRKDSELSHIHMWAGERVNRMKLEWTDNIDGHAVGGMGGNEVDFSPLELKYPSFYVNGMMYGCCQKNHHTRLCYAEITTNQGGQKNTLVGGRKPAVWRVSKPACCRAVNAYGHAGNEVDSFQLVYLKNEDYNAITEAMPGYPGQPRPKIGRRAFEIGQQSNKRATSTEIIGDHDLENHSLIDHSELIEDNYRISKIVTYCSDRVEGIQLTYANLHNPEETRVSEFHGLKVGQLREMDLSKGDYVHTVDNSNCNDAETGRSQVCGLVFHTFLMQQHACGQSTATGQSQALEKHAMLSVTGSHEGEVLKSIGINWIPVEDHH